METEQQSEEYQFEGLHDTVSSFGKEVFGEFLGELSRKRQASLLVSAAITILLSFAVVEPVESEFAGIKFTFTNTNIIPAITGLFCLYFFVTYLISALQDLQLAKYRSMPVWTASEKLLEKFVDALEKKGRMLEQKQQEIKTEQEYLQNLLEEYTVKNKGTREQLALAFQRHKSEIISMEESGASVDDISNAREKQSKEIVEIASDFLSSPEYQDIVAESKKQREPFVHDKSLGEKSHVLVKAVQRYLYFRAINVAIEIVFPSALALFAIGASIWKIAQ